MSVQMRAVKPLIQSSLLKMHVSNSAIYLILQLHVALHNDCLTIVKCSLTGLNVVNEGCGVY